MSTLKSSLVNLAVVSVLSIAVSALLAGESAAAVPQKASSQQEEISSASASTTPSTVLTLQ